MNTHLQIPRSIWSSQFKRGYRGSLPGIFPTILFVILIVAAMASVFRVHSFGPLPITDLLDAWLIALLLCTLILGVVKELLAFAIVVAYGLTISLLALFNGAPLFDFLQAYRWLFYLGVIAISVGQSWKVHWSLKVTTWTVSVMAFAKSLLTYVVVGGGERPGLFLENNYEIPLLCGLAAVSFHFLSRWWRIGLVLLLGAWVLLTESRSGAVIYAIFALYAITQVGIPRRLLKWVASVASPIVLAVPVIVFAMRTRSLNIDRLNFFSAFIHDVQQWDLVNWIFGSLPITPLSADTCWRLNYYSKLFSSQGDGTCYSVIYHSYFLRIIHDSGILGVFIAFGMVWYCMARANVSHGLLILLVAIAVANSLSVSGLNNPYVILPILLAIVTSRDQARTIRNFDDHVDDLFVLSTGSRWSRKSMGV